VLRSNPHALPARRLAQRAGVALHHAARSDHAFAQIGIIGFDGQIEVEALRLYGLPKAAPAILSGCPALPAGGRTLTYSASWDLPIMRPGATTNADVTVPGARWGDFADASLDTSSIAFVLDCHV
jgi:hypothetical protein